MTIGETEPVERPVRRGRAILAGVLVMIVCVGAVVLTRQIAGDGEPRSASEDYGAVGVPWWSGREVHWAGHSMPEDEVASFTASRDAAVFLHDRLQRKDDVPVERGPGTLTALFSDGTVERLAPRVVGVPLADPTSHLVAWMVRTDADTVTVTAFDTAERVERGSRQIEVDDEDDLLPLTAVVGDTVYLSTGARALAWHPLDGDGPPEVVAEQIDGFRAVIGATAEGLVVVGEGLETFWLGHDGTERRIGAAPGSLSPDGQFLTAPEEDDQYGWSVRAVPSGERVELDLPGDEQPYQARWAGDGLLVVGAVSGSELEEGWDDAHEVTNYACHVPDGECRALSGGPQVIYQLPLYQDSFLGEFLIGTEGMFS
ncbi:hypothetical protein [Nocardioides antri]|uniref:WD40 repeat domain-containing protein n=1 Tax=Nocardioides antri TaxID=2607659 RepID=A0A5B1M8C8_9ACTN|nr:hypothetical protein [Nocardioides antri]KAA1428788.1 hypothetical protein F0U47_00775 [Nocardioides antri]